MQRLFVNKATAPNAPPKAKAPVSPINTLPGLRLCAQKPKQLPLMQAQNIINSGEVEATDAPNPKSVIAPKPPINPSTPSERLVALLSATSTKPASGQNSKPKGNTQPKGKATFVEIAG